MKWLAANLRTTHYNDGTEIPVVDGGTDAWDALTAPAACITENNADYREKYGLLYNYYAVEKGDLCPKGWKVPSKEELGLLPVTIRPIRPASPHCRPACPSATAG